jgi:hypothetical protein
MALFSGAEFVSLIGIAGGAVALIVALLLLPAYRIACKLSDNRDTWIVARPFRGTVWLILIIGIFYILMAAGSVLVV